MRSRLLILLIALCIPACATSTPPATPPQWTSLPPVILEAFCAKLRSEAISGDAEIAIVRTTQPLATAASLRYVAQLYGRDGDMTALAQALNAANPPMPIDFERSTSCSWRPIDRIDSVEQRDVVVVELSSPFVNPFTRGESGLLARMTLGGHDAQWYWIPLAERKGRWSIGLVMPTGMHE